MSLTEAGREVRERLAAVLAPLSMCTTRGIAVALSGGMDSASVLLAARDAGLSPFAITFTLDDRLSTDARRAIELADALGIRRLLVRLPRSAIAADLERMIRRGVEGKAKIECLWPFARVLHQAASEFDVLATGSAADGHFGLSKKAMINFREPKEKFDAFRIAYFSDPDRAQVETLGRVAEDYDVLAIAPYFDRAIQEIMRRFSWDELNRPRQKEILRLAFPELDRFAVPRHCNLQLGDSGIAEHLSAVACELARERHPASAYRELVKRWSPRRPGGPE